MQTVKIGDKFGLLTVTAFVEPQDYKKKYNIRVDCRCGFFFETNEEELLSGKHYSCGCKEHPGLWKKLNIKSIPLINDGEKHTITVGQRINGVTVKGFYVKVDENGIRELGRPKMVNCRCKCGTEFLITPRCLYLHKKCSCGCDRVNGSQAIITETLTLIE